MSDRSKDQMHALCVSRRWSPLRDVKPAAGDLRQDLAGPGLEGGEGADEEDDEALASDGAPEAVYGEYAGAVVSSAQQAVEAYARFKRRTRAELAALRQQTAAATMELGLDAKIHSARDAAGPFVAQLLDWKPPEPRALPPRPPALYSARLLGELKPRPPARAAVRFDSLDKQARVLVAPAAAASSPGGGLGSTRSTLGSTGLSAGYRASGSADRSLLRKGLYLSEKQSKLY